MLAGQGHYDLRLHRPTLMRTLRAYLAILVLGAMLPGTLLTTVLVWRAFTNTRSGSERRLLESARVDAAALDREFAATINLLDALATSPALDREDYSRWYDYSRARDDMFAGTDTEFAPWHVARTDDKRRGRLNVITHLLEQIPYKGAKHEKVQLPKRGKRGDYRESDHPFRYIEEVF